MVKKMANTFRKIYKKTGNSGSSSDYELVGNIGVNGVELDIMQGASSSEDGKIGLVPKPTAGQEDYILFGNGTWKSGFDMKTYTMRFSSHHEENREFSIYYLNGIVFFPLNATFKSLTQSFDTIFTLSDEILIPHEDYLFTIPVYNGSVNILVDRDSLNVLARYRPINDTYGVPEYVITQDTLIWLC